MTTEAVKYLETDEYLTYRNDFRTGVARMAVQVIDDYADCREGKCHLCEDPE